MVRLKRAEKMDGYSSQSDMTDSKKSSGNILNFALLMSFVGKGGIACTQYIVCQSKCDLPSLHSLGKWSKQQNGLFV